MCSLSPSAPCGTAARPGPARPGLRAPSLCACVALSCACWLLDVFAAAVTAGGCAGGNYCAIMLLTRSAARPDVAARASPPTPSCRQAGWATAHTDLIWRAPTLQAQVPAPCAFMPDVANCCRGVGLSKRVERLLVCGRPLVCMMRPRVSGRPACDSSDPITHHTLPLQASCSRHTAAAPLLQPLQAPAAAGDVP